VILKALIKTGKVYRLNDKRVLMWLKCKVEKINATIISSDISIQANMAVVSSVMLKTAKPSTDDIINYSISILADYVEKHWIEQLCAEYGVNVGKEKVVASLYFNPTYERAGLPTKKDDTLKKKPRVSAAQKKLSSVDKKGMSPITSYFLKN